MQQVVAMVFAGGRVPELSVLTEKRPKSAVIFAGTYRTIDFALTNLTNSGINHVGILAQYRPASLVNHVGIGMAWDLVGTNRGITFLSPYIGPDLGEWYRGPADALYQNIEFINKHKPEDVLIVSGDHAYSMDYTHILNFHREKASDLTMAFKPIKENPSRFGIGELNAVGQLVNFTEKPEHPRSNFASIGVYVFKREILVNELLKAVSSDKAKTYHIHEVIRRMIPHYSAYGYIFHGDWFYTRTVDEYYQFHMDLINPESKLDLKPWHVRSETMSRDMPSPLPARFLSGAKIENALVCAGCEIAGTVNNSVLSPGVCVAKDAVVSDSVLWDNVHVEKGARLHRVISDKHTIIGQNAVIGTGKTIISEEMPQSLTKGITLLGRDIQIPEKTKIGYNCILHSNVSKELLIKEIPSGKSLP